MADTDIFARLVEVCLQEAPKELLQILVVFEHKEALVVCQGGV
jgi:hypothetical protein